MRPSPAEQPFVYVNGVLPAHLSAWAADAGIKLKAGNEQAIYSLNYNLDKLQLDWLGEDNFSPVSVQTPVKNRVSSSNLLIKALGKKTNVVADLTAGLGVDALTIAATGRTVFCIERCPPVALLLFDGISRCEDVVSKFMNLYFYDSNSWLGEYSGKLDAIYIDTMFSNKKKTAKSSKQMQILRKLAGTDQDAESLLTNALNQNVTRVIVKKSANAALPAIKPIAQYKGKSIRFDVFKPEMKA